MDIATRILIEAPLGVVIDLERAGSTLENAHVYDSVARALTDRVADGWVEVVQSQSVEVDGSALITQFRFRRLR